MKQAHRQSEQAAGDFHLSVDQRVAPETNQRVVCFTFHFGLEDEPFMSSKVAFCTVDYVCMYLCFCNVSILCGLITAVEANGDVSKE